MTSIDPNNRLSAKQYLEEWRVKLFPDYFYDFLHDFVGALSTRNHFDSKHIPMNPKSFLDNRINFIFTHFDKVISHLGAGNYQTKLEQTSAIEATREIVPALLDLPGWKHVVSRQSENKSQRKNQKDDGALIIISLISSSLRNVSRSSIKLRGLDLMLALCELINDEAKLDRVLPYMLSLLEDQSEYVQAAAIRNMTQLLELVKVITPMNGGLFEYIIFPRLEHISKSESVLFRATYASCLPSLAQTASRFLEMGQILKTTGMLDSIDPETENGSRTETISYDSYRQNLILMFEGHASLLLTDSSTAVKKAFLNSITPLCIFFGRQMTNDVILTHLITYLNDPDASLRCQFFDCIIGLGPFIGPTSLEQYIQPLMIQALNDPEEYVISKTFEAFASFSELGLLRKPDTWSILKIAIRYIIHPNSWIRNNVLRFLNASVTWMTPAERFCMLEPIIRPFMECECLDFSPDSLIRCFKPPLSRTVYNAAKSWAAKARKSSFWKLPALKSNRANSLDNDLAIPLPTSFDQIAKSSEDETRILLLKDNGTTADELWKIAVLREHIYRVARLSSRLQIETTSSELNSEVNLATDLKIPTQTYEFPTHYELSRDGGSDFSNFDDIREALQDSLQHKVDINSLSSDSPVQRRSGDIEFSDDGSAVIQAKATTATDTTDVYGLVAQPFSRQNQASPSKFQFSAPSAEHKITEDPYLEKLLKTVYVEPIKSEPSEFGPQTVPVTHAEQLHNPASPIKKTNWKPAGVLASQFTEHKSAINKICMAPDHIFFVTCSDDGYVKLWDCGRLEKNVINKSAQTYHCGETKAKFVCFIENTYTFAVSCTDGTVQFVRVDVVPPKDAQSKPRYRKMSLVRTYHLKSDEYAVWMEHIKIKEGSILVMATTKSRIIGLDMNSMKESFVFNSPYSHGIPTCFVIDKRKTWLLLGTSLGVLELWDLRFRLLVKTWTFVDPAPVRRLFHREKESGSNVVVLGGTSKSEISTWNLNEATCSEVYRANQNVENSHPYQLIQFEEGPNSRRYTQEKRKNGSVSVDGTEEPNADTELLCMATGFDSPRKDDDNRHVHIISGGSDRKIRFWDLQSVESNSIVSGLAAESEAVSFFRSYNNTVKVFGEKIVHGANSKTPAGSTKAGRPSRSARTAIIALEQQDLARNHQASIVDIAILHKPYQMIVSADRAGVVKVFI